MVIYSDLWWIYGRSPISNKETKRQGNVQAWKSPTNEIPMKGHHKCSEVGEQTLTSIHDFLLSPLAIQISKVLVQICSDDLQIPHFVSQPSPVPPPSQRTSKTSRSHFEPRRLGRTPRERPAKAKKETTNFGHRTC